MGVGTKVGFRFNFSEIEEGYNHLENLSSIQMFCEILDRSTIGIERMSKHLYFSEQDVDKLFDIILKDVDIPHIVHIRKAVKISELDFWKNHMFQVMGTLSAVLSVISVNQKQFDRVFVKLGKILSFTEDRDLITATFKAAEKLIRSKDDLNAELRVIKLLRNISNPKVTETLRSHSEYIRMFERAETYEAAKSKEEQGSAIEIPNR